MNIPFALFEAYPTLVMDIIDYFNSAIQIIKTPMSFVHYYFEQGKVPNIDSIQPAIIANICYRLQDKGYMSINRQPAFDGWNDVCCTFKDNLERDLGNQYDFKLNAAVYGFEYVYFQMKEYVKPLLSFSEKHPDGQMGTFFEFNGGIVTCRHCLAESEHVALKGYSAELLNKTMILCSENEGVDVVFIPNVNTNKYNSIANAKIMSEVMAMGYPNLPGFDRFLNVEKSLVSFTDRKMVPTKGSVSSTVFDYLAKSRLMMITAKIRGGNSGGPIVDSDGNLVGVASGVPEFDGNDYDRLGYGLAVLADELIAIINSGKEYSVGAGFFKDYPQ